MKKLILLLTLLLIVINPVLALKGVGISWSQESAIIPEDQKTCITYGIYNPFDEDVEITLNVEGALADLNSESETKYVRANTLHGKAETLEVCFDVPRTYEENCIIPGLVCEQKCEVDELIMDGEVVAREAPKLVSGATGSATVAMASVPLKVKVSCVPHGMNYAILLVFVLAAVVIGVAYSRKKSKK